MTRYLRRDDQWERIKDRPPGQRGHVGVTAQDNRWCVEARHKGRRFAVDVPEALVPEVQRCLDNGRALQEQLYEAAPRYVKALKRARATAAEASAE